MASQHFLVVSYACSNQAHSVGLHIRFGVFTLLKRSVTQGKQGQYFRLNNFRVYSSMVEQGAFNSLVVSSNLTIPIASLERVHSLMVKQVTSNY